MLLQAGRGCHFFFAVAPEGWNSRLYEVLHADSMTIMIERRRKLRERIVSLAEPEFRKFSASLVPGASRLLGVRMPVLRELAREEARRDWRELLDAPAEEPYAEEVMLDGMLVGMAGMAPEERLERVAQFVTRMDNWAVCDTFCSSLKFSKRHPALVWNFIQPYLKSPEVYHVRFAVVMMLAHFITEEYVERALALLDGVRHEDYYVSMAVAWAVSVCYVKFPELTLEYLRHASLSDFTYNKALQKIIESLRVSREDKDLMRSMKRRKQRGGPALRGEG